MRNYRHLIIVFGIVLALVIFGGWIKKPLENIVNFFVIPPAKAANGFSAKTFNLFDVIRSIRTLRAENEKLKNKNMALESEIAGLKEVRYENEILKKELAFSQNEAQEKKSLLPAEIVSRSPNSFLEFLIINRGSDDGVEENQAVISQGYLIGKAVDVTAKTAKVFLINNPTSLIPVVLQESRGTGLLRGGLDGLRVEEVTLDTQVKIGENVITSDLGGELPDGLIIGTVEKIISKSSEIFQKISIISPVEFSRLEMVFVVK